MPTADSFTALGAGNGFPFCHTSITRVDISNSLYSNYKWTTLSGVNSDNYNSFDDATLSQKVDSSRDMAMRIYWNKFKSNGLNASSSGSYKEKNRFYDEEISWNESVTGMSSDDVDVPEPSDRICTQLGDGTTKQGTFTPSYFRYYLRDYKAELYAFYDSDKFLGYGAELSTSEALLVNWCRCRIEYEALKFKYSEINTSFHKRSVDFGTIGGMHFVRFRSGEIEDIYLPSGDGYSGLSSSPSITLNENGVQASHSYSWYYTSPSTGEETWRDMDFQISASGPTSIDFYTY